MSAAPSPPGEWRSSSPGGSGRAPRPASPTARSATTWSRHSPRAVTTASGRLSRKLDLVVPSYGTPGRLLIEHPRARELCPAYLSVGAYLALAMVPLMEAALDRARLLAPADPVAAGLVGYLEHHIPEEMHGDEPGAE